MSLFGANPLSGIPGQIVGGVINAIGAKKAYKRNIRMMERQNQYNIDMWNRQNAYNDPSAQMERVRNAGLNAFSVAGGQNAAGLASAPQAAADAPDAPNVMAPIATVMNNISDKLLAAYKINKDVELKKEGLKQQERNLNQLEELRAAQADKLGTDNILGLQQYEYYKRYMPLKLKDLEKSVEFWEQRWKESDEKILTSATRRQILDAEARDLSFKLSSLNPQILENLKADVRVKNANAWYIAKKTLLLATEEKLMNMRYDNLKLQYNMGTLEYINYPIMMALENDLKRKKIELEEYMRKFYKGEQWRRSIGTALSVFEFPFKIMNGMKDNAEKAAAIGFKF